MRRRDTLGVTINDIKDQGNECIVYVDTKDGTAEFHVTDPAEIGVLLQGVERSIFKGTDYIFFTKKKGIYVQETLSSTTITNNSITSAIGFPVYSEVLRYAYVHYLHIHKKLEFEEIQALLGTSNVRAADILKEALVRVKNVDYNMQITT